jgi:DNA-binding beta-propeller fold protein YncE
MKRFLWLGFVLFFYLICTGCGDTFRPIIIPNPPVFPNPQASHTVLSLNYNDVCSQQLNPCPNFVPLAGTAMVIDVSGDTDVSIANTGITPVHAVQQSASQVLVVNQALTGYAPPLDGGCLITQTPPNPVLNVCPSITKLSYSNTVISSTATISLPASSAANFVATTESSQAYVLLPNYIPDITNPAAVVPSVEVVNTTSNNLVTTIPVGHNPIAMSETPDGKKLYVANEGDSTISGFNTLGFSQRVGSPTATSSAPIWLLARSDSQQVYALEANGALEWLNTTSTAGPDTLTQTSPIISVPNATRMVYDPNLNRLYIPGGSQVAMVDVSQSAPSTIADFTIAEIPPSSRSASDPCSATAAATLNTVDVAALPDGTRAYVGSYYEDAVNNIEYICPQVTVINTVNNAVETPAIAIPGFAAYDAFCSPLQSPNAPRFRIMMAAGGDSTRVYLSSCDGGMVNIIDTSSETYGLNLPAPVSSRTVVGNNGQNPPQNPVFLLAGP